GKRKMMDLSEEIFLVTGAHGFIGAWVVKQLLSYDATVVRFDQSEDARRLRQIMDEDEISKADLVTGDITDPDLLPRVLEDFGVTRAIHLAGLQVPSCKANPQAGAAVNVIGAINVFEAVKRVSIFIDGLAYASSAAVFGTEGVERPLTEQDDPHPTTLYGAFKRCNENTARVYYLDYDVSSVGLRPLTVYGVGRDFGLTSDPTKAMKAAGGGRVFQIRCGGKTDFLYVADAADAFIRAATSGLTGASVFNLHGETASVSDVIAEIEKVLPESRGTISQSDEPLAIPPAIDGSAIRRAVG